MRESVISRARVSNGKKVLPSVIIVIMLVTVSATAVVASSEGVLSKQVSATQDALSSGLSIGDVTCHPLEASVDEPVQWVVYVILQDHGQQGKGLLFTWDWDDGTYTVNHLKSVSNSDTAIDAQTHAWSEPGTYDVTVSVWDGYGSEKNRFHNVSETVQYTVKGDAPTRTVDYRWYDMFAHELGPWYAYRSLCYGDEYAVTDSYPYLYVHEYAPPGNSKVKTFMQLEVNATNLPEVNMIDNPEFLPLLGTSRGGSAFVSWDMDYLTWEEAEEKLSPAALAWYDGWFIGLNGTITLDTQGAKSVLGVSDSDLDDFDSWWETNQPLIEDMWAAWLMNEASNSRLAIYNMYEYDLTFVYFDIDAYLLYGHVVVEIDTVSWGMEALMTRWLHEAFMPTEWYMEDVHLAASIGPYDSDVWLDAAVGYALVASETINDGAPCWVWQAMLQDYVLSSAEYPISDFDPYAGLEYYCRYPGNEWYHQDIPYDYTPGSWNLAEGETLSFEWPEGEVLFFVDDPTGVGSGTVEGALDLWSSMTVVYTEPMPPDAPGNVVIDNHTREVIFTGPFDMLTWSRDQVAHSFLSAEWDRLGVLPYGVPYIEFRAVETQNMPPIASFTVDPPTGTLDTHFLFDASASYDHEDPSDALVVRWDWNGDTVWDTVWSTVKIFEHQFTAQGCYEVVLEVMDSGGLTNQASNTVLVGEGPSGYITRGPICILSDDEFLPENGVVGGMGTHLDPYIIQGWSINASEADGIRIEGTSSFFIVRGLEVFDGEFLLDEFEANDGVTLSDVSNGRVESVDARDCRYGVSVFDSDNVVVSGNTAYRNSIAGICLHNCECVNATSNFVHNNTANGITVGYCYSCLVVDNWVEGTGWNGVAQYSIEVMQSEFCFVYGNVVVCGVTGIGLSASANCAVEDNEVVSHDGHAIYLRACDSSRVVGNYLASLSSSIYAYDCRSTLIADNEAYPSWLSEYWTAEITCDFCYDTTVVGNRVNSHNASGIEFYYCTGSSALENDVIAKGYGIRCYGCTGSTVMGNVVTTDVTNGIILLFCTDSNVAGNSVVSDLSAAIVLHTCEESIVAGNAAVSNNYGIYLTSCANSLVEDNQAHSYGETGLYISISTNTEVVGNTASSEGSKFWTACMILSLLTDAIVTRNNVNGGLHGILVSQSTGVIVYHNNLVDNSVQGYDDRGSENSWDNGYPDGGNYWSSYDGVDEMSGVAQDVPGPDGIGDTPYVIDSNSTDSYPLMSPYEPGLPPGPEDLIAVSEGSSVTIYEQTGGVYSHSFSVEELMTAGGTFTTAAMLLEEYTVTSEGDYLTIHCYRNPPYPMNGTGTGNNIVAVRLDGVDGYPDGLWASVIVGYTMGVAGIEESRWNALGPADQVGPFADSLCTYLGDYDSELVLGFTAPSTPPSESSLTYTIYDMFGEPWGDWWDKRPYGDWDTDRLLTADAGEVTSLYSVWGRPKSTTDDQGMIYAPYRYNITGANLPNIDVHSPTFVPVLGSGPISGAEASMAISFQYGSEEWWNEYWIPEWGDHPGWGDWEDLPSVFDDGWYVYTVYDIAMNREAAEEWLGLAADEDPTAWWAANEAMFVSIWDGWIIDQGNEVYDIYSGYDFAYYVLAPTLMRLSGDSNRVVLEVAHVSWGYEALMTRWLSSTEISVHQTYMEDFKMFLDLREDDFDMTMDAVCQWSLHCVKQDAAVPGDNALCAWVWEPLGLDYVPSVSGHPSTYDPYDPVIGEVTYRSWNCGDPNYDSEVGYEVTPWALTLPSYASLVFVLPQGVDTIGYYAEPVPEDALKAVWNEGDYSVYDNLRYYGEMEPGYLGLSGCSDWSYDPSLKMLTINGPWEFTNPHPDNSSLLYHGAPWIEFNVMPLVGDEPAGAEESSSGSTSGAVAGVSGLTSLAWLLSAVVLTATAFAARVGRRLLSREPQ
jgi:parallel beta-helix repeat protein